MLVLETIRALLKFKDYTTIAEIASTAGIKRASVLDIINKNGAYVWRNRKNGHITKVDPQTQLVKDLWESGQFYKIDTYGAWSKEGEQIVFEGNDELKKSLQEQREIGAITDHWPIKIIENTERNRKIVEDAGLRPWSEAQIDDRLWSE